MLDSKTAAKLLSAASGNFRHLSFYFSKSSLKLVEFTHFAFPRSLTRHKTKTSTFPNTLIPSWFFERPIWTRHNPLNYNITEFCKRKRDDSNIGHLFERSIRIYLTWLEAYLFLIEMRNTLRRPFNRAFPNLEAIFDWTNFPVSNQFNSTSEKEWKEIDFVLPCRAFLDH